MPQRSGSLLKRWLVPAVFILLVSGCIVGPDHEPPCVCAPDQWHQQLTDGHYVNIEELREWWWLFDDPALGQLIETAKAQNLDLYTAFTRICQARAQVCIARSDLYPSVGGNSAYQRSLIAPNSLVFGGVPGFIIGALDNWSLGWDTAWELNLFGHVTRQIEAADANLSASIESYRDIMVVLLADVAATYVELRTLQERLKFAWQNVKIQQEALELAKKRVEGGISPILDQYQAESNLAATEAQIPSLELQIHQALNRLAVLLGEYPGALHCQLAEPKPIPSPPTTLPQAIPCDVIRQRPDIRLAERQLAARTAELGIAVADLFPRLRFDGTFGLQSLEFSKLFTADSWGYQVGPALRWPIFQAGRILCNIEGAEAAAEETYAAYEQTVLRAIEEVENSIVGYTKEVRRKELLGQTVVAAEKQLGSVLELYRSGKTDFQNVLDTLRTLSLAQDALATTEGAVVQQLVSFYRSLGGGWDPDHHCGTHCVRLGCPERCEAGLVERLNAVEDDVTNIYETQPERGPSESASEGENDDLNDQLERLPGLDESTVEPSYQLDSYFDRARIPDDGDE